MNVTHVSRTDLGSDGAQGRIRTTDTRIFNPLLYQQSYLGVAAASPQPETSVALTPAKRAGLYHAKLGCPAALDVILGIKGQSVAAPFG